MSEHVTEVSAERRALQDKIDAVEGYIQSAAHQQYQAAIEAEVEETTLFILNAMPDSLGAFTAHFAALGKLQGLRVLKEKTTDLLREMREELETLD